MSREMDMAFTWDDIGWIRKRWKGPIIVKGLLTVEDSMRAVHAGADGIVISNHGGRQLDGAPSPLEQLPRIAEATHGRIRILVDGGARRGSDIAKALALGADAVLLGRAPLYGLAARGPQGVAEVLTLLRTEFEVTLRLLGAVSSASLDNSYIA